MSAFSALVRCALLPRPVTCRASGTRHRPDSISRQESSAALTPRALGVTRNGTPERVNETSHAAGFSLGEPSIIQG